MHNRRGAGILFSQDVTKNFLKRNHLHLVVRSHQMVDSGFNRCHMGKMATVFSASSYCGTNDNLAAIAVFDASSGKLSFIQFHAETNLLAFSPSLSKEDLDPRMVSPSPQQQNLPSSSSPPSSSSSSTSSPHQHQTNSSSPHKNYDETLTKLHERILRKRHTLYMAFAQLDRKSGFITLNDWANVMTMVIRIDLHWQALWPYLGYKSESLTDTDSTLKSASPQEESQQILSSPTTTTTTTTATTTTTTTTTTNSPPNASSSASSSSPSTSHSNTSASSYRKAKDKESSSSSSSSAQNHSSSSPSPINISYTVNGLPEFINYTKFLDMYTTFVDPEMASILEKKQSALVEKLCRKFYERVWI